MKNFGDLPRQERIDKVMSLRRPDMALVLEDLIEDQNISAIIRTAEAFGIGKIYIIDSQNRRPHLSSNVSSGATKWMEIEKFDDVGKCFKALKKEKYTLVGALVDPQSDILWEQDFSGKIAVVMGCEPKGLSETAQKLMDKNIYLPMFGLTESLNVSVAAGIFMYEVIRQKET